MNHALYFVGYTEKKEDGSKGPHPPKGAFLGLDPHVCYSSPSPTSVRLSDSHGTTSSVPAGAGSSSCGGSGTDTGVSSHTMQWNPSFPTDELLGQIHTERIDEVDFRSLDPSLTLGYYFRNRYEFTTFCTHLQEVNKDKIARKVRPLFTVENSPPVGRMVTGFGYDDDLDSDPEVGRNSDDDDDEYVFI